MHRTQGACLNLNALILLFRYREAWFTAGSRTGGRDTFATKTSGIREKPRSNHIGRNKHKRF